ncbi:hypothetical protein MN032_04940 [Agromyces atrinae]|uniref:DUF6578 domain-containing protein n=1 Tax=Agromyces atrinae TaxID=592376 RepID=UPI001F57DAF7|nr:DUF6578 domain-containing protein [Agromyces atrinae]MCI2957030.1 hypothetical protein [Agromyces atrinae]
MLVWLTDWQLAEDHLLIAVGDRVEWTLYPADANWVSRLFGDRLVIDWQFDTYGDAVDQPSIRTSGTVTGLQGVRCRQVRTDEGIVPVTGSATLLPVTDTSGSWAPVAKAFPSIIADGSGTSFSYTSIHDDVTSESLYGYVASIE